MNGGNEQNTMTVEVQTEWEKKTAKDVMKQVTSRVVTTVAVTSPIRQIFIEM